MFTYTLFFLSTYLYPLVLPKPKLDVRPERSSEPLSLTGDFWLIEDSDGPGILPTAALLVVVLTAALVVE